MQLEIFKCTLRNTILVVLHNLFPPPPPSVTSGSHATTTKKKARGKSRACAEPTSGQGHFRTGPLPVTWLCHFRSKGPTRADMAQLPVAHAQNILPDRVTSGHVTDVTSGPKGTPKGSSDLRSHPVLLLRKKRGKKPGMCRTYFRSGPLPDRASSGHVTLSLPAKRPH